MWEREGYRQWGYYWKVGAHILNHKQEEESALEMASGFWNPKA